MVGGAVWDLLAARTARMIAIGVLTGGSGQGELLRVYRVYRGPAELGVEP